MFFRGSESNVSRPCRTLNPEPYTAVQIFLSSEDAAAKIQELSDKVAPGPSLQSFPEVHILFALGFVLVLGRGLRIHHRTTTTAAAAAAATTPLTPITELKGNDFGCLGGLQVGVYGLRMPHI